VNEPGRLYFGHIAHRRHAPVEHDFRYSAFSLVLDIDRIADVSGHLKLFAVEGFNLFSFRNKDHGARNGSALRPWVEAELRNAGVEERPARIELLCFPRILGFVFNPLSVYFCVDESDHLFAIVYEVKNTFGGQHSYVGKIDNRPRKGERAAEHGADKAFYVSPFIGSEAHYAFTASLPGEKLKLTIDETGPDGPILWAGWFGSNRELTDRNLLSAFFIYPLMTLKVVAGIHWQALRLFLKGVKYHPQHIEKPQETTRADSRNTSRT